MGASLEVEGLRAALLQRLQGFVALPEAGERERFTRLASAILAGADADALRSLVARVTQGGDDWGYHRPEPLARQLHYAMAEVTLEPGSGLAGAQHLQALGDGPLILLPNHLSYSDANLIEILLHRAGFDALAGRLTVIAGPKVYSDPQRRFSSLCFGTIKTAQSTTLASEQAPMSAREVARLARRTIELSFERLAQGDALLIFGEGSRSRNAAMQPLLPAVSRYLERPGVQLLPLGIHGTEHLSPLDDSQIHPTRVNLTVGEVLDSTALSSRCNRKRPAMAEAIGRAIAATLPPAYRGVYG
ncbi:MAG: 1-acyl-sn-glycerol-3-phosphate acyltransferase [Myxococcales bacterium]|nr:1-acyl-sn-glycerol-3-phosphate acyltransferase [Myxococcales bacterium]